MGSPLESRSQPRRSPLIAGESVGSRGVLGEKGGVEEERKEGAERRGSC